jgi:Tol biopolymer transport system component
LVDWIAEQDHGGANYLDEVLVVTQRTRQRPAWSFPERWIPVQLTLRRVAVPRPAIYLALLAILIAVAIAAASLVGMQRRTPAPFGPASNGLLAYVSRANDIVLLDPRTGESRTLVGGPETDRNLSLSFDGTRVAFVRTAKSADTVIVADLASGRLVTVTPEGFPDVSQVAWSPDGRNLAIVAEFESSSRIWLASTDGTTPARMLDTGIAADEVAWRPPDGRELLFRGTATPGSGYRLYLVNPDGTNERALPPPVGFDRSDYGVPGFSPDGQRIFYVRWAAEPYRGHAYVFDFVSNLETEIGPRDERSVAAVHVSPDADRISVAMPELIDHGRLQIAVAAADGTGSVVNTGPLFSDVNAYHRWSPDGTTILAWRAPENLVLYLDPAGGPSRTFPWPNVMDPDWQRVAP